MTLVLRWMGLFVWRLGGVDSMDGINAGKPHRMSSKSNIFDDCSTLLVH